MPKFPRRLLLKAFLSALSFAMLVLSCVFLYGLPQIVLLIAIILFASLGVIISNTDDKHETFFKSAVVTLALLSFALVTYIILDKTRVLHKLQDPESLLVMIRATKHWGIIIFILLVVFQIIFLPIPTAVTAFIGSRLYGATLAFVFITVGTVIGSIICFMLGRVFGKKLVAWMIGKEKTEKYAEVLNRKGRFVFILMMLFPFFPDDILCLVAGMTAMSYKYFITAISLTRPVMIGFMCYFVEGAIIPFSGWGVPVWIAIFAVTIVLFIFLGRLKNYIFNKKSGVRPVKAPKAAPSESRSDK